MGGQLKNILNFTSMVLGRWWLCEAWKGVQNPQVSSLTLKPPLIPFPLLNGAPSKREVHPPLYPLLPVRNPGGAERTQLGGDKTLS